ncbi:hypothetical protein MTP04_34790 [Lysinibacillus sp. PLM2]|nr:hypothetical protein MTP04_34790 [Lysinibacillus sp. PLM2]
MNKFKLILSVPFFCILLFGCNTEEQDTNTTINTSPNVADDEETGNRALQDQDNQDEDDTNQAQGNTNQAQENANANNGGGEGDKPYLFTNFDLDVDYENDISYEADYEINQNEVKAEIEDQINNIVQTGEEAKTTLEQYFEQFSFNEHSKDEEVAGQVIAAFRLPEDYVSVELEVRYDSGTVKEYKFTR